MAQQEREHIYGGTKHAGQAVLEVFDLLDLASLEPQRELLDELPVLERVVFYGSSGSGKSTLEQAVRGAAREGTLHDISIPNRIVTRPKRPDDMDIDHHTEEELTRMVEADEVGMYGVKVMEGGREEPFGLSQPEPGRLPVFMANNTVILHPERIRPQTFLQGALLVNIYAPDEVRGDRIKRRSPDMSPAEFAYRMSEKESAERMRAPAHIVVHNHGANLSRTRADIVRFIGALT